MSETKMVSVRLDEGLVEWLDEYAKERSTTRTVLLENAIAGFREEARSGVPELRARVRAAQAPREGECCCAVFPDGRRGFRQACPVHGGKTREDFAKATADRSELFRSMETPESSRFGVEAAAKMKARREAGDNAA